MKVYSLPNDEVIKNIEDGEGYKYLGTLEADRFKTFKMKKKMGKKYFRSIKKILKSKINSGNIMKAVISKTVAVVR